MNISTNIRPQKDFYNNYEDFCDKLDNTELDNIIEKQVKPVDEQVKESRGITKWKS